MLLNLKEAGERGENGGGSYSDPSETISDMDFSALGNRQQYVLLSSSPFHEAYEITMLE